MGIIQWLDANTLINFAIIGCHAYWEIIHQREQKTLWVCRGEKGAMILWVWSWEKVNHTLSMYAQSKKVSMKLKQLYSSFFMGACELAPKSALLLMDAKIAIFKHSYVTQLQNEGLNLSSSP